MDQSSQNKRNAAGIILAAGAASRMGQPKLLLIWKGETLIHRVARTAIEAGLDPVIIVTGSESQKMACALQDLAVQIVHNPDWQSGQSTSVRVGVQALPVETSAALFLLGDQPFVSTMLIQKLVETYFEIHSVLLAPYVGDNRGNPVVFDHSIFDQLCCLQGDAGARSIFASTPPQSMPWFDERILFDIDTPADYEQLTKMV
jgi:molybdenum cofactor cytidylyltransferase